jgi:hypothetical protein
MTRTAVAVFAVFLLLSACDAADAPGQAADPTSTSTVSAPSPAPSSTIDTDEITPAVGITRSAGTSFTEEGLSDQRRSPFVPLNEPEMVASGQVTWLLPESIVMGAVHESGETHAYPISQMAYHHIANTKIAGEPFLVTY